MLLAKQSKEEDRLFKVHTSIVLSLLPLSYSLTMHMLSCTARVTD